MAMPLTIRPLSDAMGGEIAGIDLRNPLDDTTFAAIETALDDHLVIVFRNQDLDPPALAAFGQRFGKLRPHALESYRHKEHEDVSYIRNVDDEGNFDPFGKIRASTWHADATYEADLPRAAILHAKEIPASGGGTIFANMCAAYDGLPGEKQEKLADLVALHGYTTGPAAAGRATAAIGLPVDGSLRERPASPNRARQRGGEEEAEVDVCVQQARSR